MLIERKSGGWDRGFGHGVRFRNRVVARVWRSILFATTRREYVIVKIALEFYERGMQ